MTFIEHNFLTLLAAVVSATSLVWFSLARDEFYLVYGAYFFVVSVLCYVEHGRRRE